MSKAVLSHRRRIHDIIKPVPVRRSELQTGSIESRNGNRAMECVSHRGVIFLPDIWEDPVEEGYIESLKNGSELYVFHSDMYGDYLCYRKNIFNNAFLKGVKYVD